MCRGGWYGIPGEQVINEPAGVSMFCSCARVCLNQAVHIGSLIPVQCEVGNLWGCIGTHRETNALMAYSAILGEEKGVVHNKVQVVLEVVE